MGGIIIVDFIDMESKEHRAAVLERLEREMRKDKTRTHILGFTQLGLVEITRKKVKQDIGDLLHQDRAPSAKARAGAVRGRPWPTGCSGEIKKLARETDAEAILVAVNPVGGGADDRRRRLQPAGAGGADGQDASHQGPEDCRHRRGERPGRRHQGRGGGKGAAGRQGQVLDIEVEEPHVSNPRDGIARVEGYVVDIEGAGRMVGQKLKVEITKVFRTYAKGKVLSRA